MVAQEGRPATLPAGLIPTYPGFEVKTVARKKDGRRGQATVEMALVLPILIWLLVGLVDIARMANVYLIIQNASREAVRLGITGASDTQVSQRAIQMATTLDATKLTVTVSPAGAKTTGSDITVAVSYRYHVLALMGIVGSDVPLSTRLTARVE
jgi:Flp pilus assembly protein TadG